MKLTAGDAKKNGKEKWKNVKGKANGTRAVADELIKSAGYLSAAILEDIIVCACIEAKNYDITDINSLLTEYGGKPFAPKEDA